MNSLIYNPKYKTKQIFELNAVPVESPQEGEAFYWLTSENGHLYANFRAYGMSSTVSVEVTAQPAGGGSGSGGKHISGASVNTSSGTITFSYSDSSMPLTVDISSLLSDENFTSAYKAKLDGMPSSFEAAGQKIAFTSADSEEVSWNGNVAAFTHSMNCLPVVTVYDNGRNQVMADMSATDSAHFSIDFGNRSAVAGTWTCVVAYGSEW